MASPSLGLVPRILTAYAFRVYAARDYMNQLGIETHASARAAGLEVPQPHEPSHDRSYFRNFLLFIDGVYGDRVPKAYRDAATRRIEEERAMEIRRVEERARVFANLERLTDEEIMDLF